MSKVLPIIQIVLAVLLVTSILFQNRGSGLSATFGGDSATYHTKRGFDKVLFVLTIILAILFVGSTFATLIIS